MVLPSRLFLHLTDLTPMQRFYIIVGVLAGVVFLQFLVIIGTLSSKRSSPTKATITQFSDKRSTVSNPTESTQEQEKKYENNAYDNSEGDIQSPPPISSDNA